MGVAYFHDIDSWGKWGRGLYSQRLVGENMGGACILNANAQGNVSATYFRNASAWEWLTSATLIKGKMGALPSSATLMQAEKVGVICFHDAVAVVSRAHISPTPQSCENKSLPPLLHELTSRKQVTLTFLPRISVVKIEGYQFLPRMGIAEVDRYIFPTNQRSGNGSRLHFRLHISVAVNYQSVLIY